MFTGPNFPTFHCHPKSLDSASMPEAFVKRELELGTGAVTVTDHGSLGACRQMYDLAKKAGITPILGLEGYFRDDDCPILTKAGVQKTEQGTFESYWKYAHMTMHFLDQAAFEVGVRVLSRTDINRSEWHGSERKPLFNRADLEELGAANITLGSGCLIGMVQRHLMQHSSPKKARAYYEWMRSLVRPGNFYVEVFPHKCDKYWVQGIFVTTEDKNGQAHNQKYWQGKKLRTNAVEEITAKDLAEAFGKKDNPHKILLGIKNQNTWEQVERDIVLVEKKEEFMLNECQPWCPDGDVQAGCNKFVIALAKQYGDPIIISDDSHFAYPEDKIVQDARLSNNQGSWKFHNSYHRQDSASAAEHFLQTSGISEAEFGGWVENSRAWAARFKDFKFTYQPSLPTKFYPENTLAHTKALILQHGRMKKDPRYLARLREEINLLHNNGILDLLPYFMTSEEASSLYRKNGLLTGPGRGSAAGLLLAYYLGITHIDPLEFDLSLDRFMTPDRIKSGKLPDIDQDFPHRDLLVDSEDPTKGWLRERFGDHVAQISTDTTLKLRSAIKDALRFRLGTVPTDIEKMTHRLESAPQGVSEYNFVFGYDTPEGHVQGSMERDPLLKDFIKNYPEDWKVVTKMLGLPRQKGRHACAYVIANWPISSRIPMTKVSDVEVTQYTAESVEASGGIKMDFLVINTLKDLSSCIQLIQERSGVEIPDDLVIDGIKVPRIQLVPHKGKWFDIWRLWVSPWCDEVFRDVAEGKTETVFQFNTPGAVKYLLDEFNHERPDGKKVIASVEDMSAFTALDRPGGLDVEIKRPDGSTVNALQEYARRARGQAPSTTLPPLFMELLPETYGIMVYQEQLQRVYQHLTGCTGPEAEDFRQNVAKKKMEKVQKVYPFFVERAGEKIGKDQAEVVWEFFKTWGRYGFNKSHSICYSVIGLSCAYLKHHFPIEWWTAVLRNADKSEINQKFWRYCGKLIDTPDVSLSGHQFEIRGGRIQAPISLLQGVGEGAHKELCDGRPYTSIQDFCDKIQVTKIAKSKMNEKTGKPRMGTSALNRGVVYTLIISGAMDSLFSPAMTTLQKLEEYEVALAKATGKKPTMVAAKYADINQITSYQMKKSILPAYSEPLLPMLLDRKIEGMHQYEEGRPSYQWANDKGELVTRPFMSASEIEHVASLDFLPEKPFQVAVAAYVEGARRFSYQQGKEACEITADVDGAKFKMVKWSRNQGRLGKQYGAGLVGSVCILLLCRYDERRPFSIDDVIVVQDKLKDDKEESA